MISVVPEEGRNTRCYLGMTPAKSRVSIRARIPSDNSAGSAGVARSLINFDFAFGANGGSLGSIGEPGSISLNEKLINVVGESPHVPHLLFFPVS